MNSKYRILLVLVALSAIIALSAFPSTSAFAEPEPTSVQDVTVWIYPEYDDSRLLVMIEGDVVGVDTPATVRFLVPSGSEMFSAGWKNDFDEYTGGPPRREPSSLPGWDEISYEVQDETFRMEYYAALIEGYPEKTLPFEYRFLYPVSDMTVVVQEPYASTNFSVIPAAESTFNDGTFDNHQYSYTDLERDETFSFDISYNRLENRPSMTILEGGSANGASDGSSNAGLIAIAAIVGVAVLGGGAFWMMRSKPPQRPASRRAAAVSDRGGKGKARAASVPDRGGKGKAGSASRFCTQCGQTVEKSHRFCPHCGSEVY